MSEPALCVVLFTSARTEMGELALCVVLSISARSAGYTGWVSLRFVWYSLLLHLVRVTSDG